MYEVMRMERFSAFRPMAGSGEMCHSPPSAVCQKSFLRSCQLGTHSRGKRSSSIQLEEQVCIATIRSSASDTLPSNLDWVARRSRLFFITLGGSRKSTATPETARFRATNVLGL